MTIRSSKAGAPSVLHVVLSLDCGGLEHVVIELCRNAAKEGRRVGVVCVERPGTLADQAIETGAEVVCLDKRPGIDWRLRRRFRSVLKRWRPDVVHTHQIGALFYAGPAAAWEGVPVVHTEHGKHYSGDRKLRWLAWYAARHCQTYVGVALDVIEHAIENRITRSGKTAVITNGVPFEDQEEGFGVEVRQTLGIPVDAPVVGSVGRLETVKNYRLLIRALASVREAIPEAKLLLVGDGSQRTALEQAARQAGVAEAVCFAGYQTNSAPFYRAMDVFCLTSDSEGLPLSLLEAMAAGTPVAASRVGGIPGVIRHGENGLLLDPGDHRATTEALQTLLGDRPLAHQYAGRAREEARKCYSSEAMAAAYAKLYSNAAKHD